MLSALFAKYMIKIIAVSVSLLSVGGVIWAAWAYYNNMQDRLTDLSSEKTELATSLRQTKAELESMRENILIIRRREAELQARAREAEVYSNELLQLLRRHDLTRLTYARPGLIQTRVNNATNEVFRELESITAIDD